MVGQLRSDHQAREGLSFAGYGMRRRGYLLDQSRLIWGDAMTGIVLSGALLFGVVIVFLLIAIRS